MGASDCCARITLAIINIFFFFLSLLFLAIGVLAYVGQSLLTSQLEHSLGAVANGTIAPDAEGMANEVLDIVQPISVALIAIGVFLLVVTILGMCGACCSEKCMLISYVVLVLLVFLAHITVFIMFMLGSYNGIQGTLTARLTANYTDIDAEDGSLKSELMNVFMIKMGCCGVVDYKDFNNTGWDRSTTINGVPTTKVTPLACCVINSTGDAYQYDDMCAVKPTNENNNWHKGCWAVFNEAVEPIYTPIVGLTAGFLGFDLVLVALAICIVVQKDKSDRKEG